MRIIYGLKQLRVIDKRPALALGVFDGLHRGHQRIISRLIKEAKKRNLKSLVATFSPHPQKEDTLYSLPYRLSLLNARGVDSCLVINFTPALRRIPAEKFLQEIIINKINPRIVLIGKNFTFGKDGKGSWPLLRAYSGKHRFKLIVMDVLTFRGQPVSSSRIRRLIRQGQIAEAKQLLGRPVMIFGRVSRGSGYGRKIGYPTANIIAESKIIPPMGVYAARVSFFGYLLPGICYIGNRPTLRLRSKVNIEVYLFDFKGNLYGRRLEVELKGRIRPQEKFNSVEELTRQIKKDINTFRLKFGHSAGC